MGRHQGYFMKEIDKFIDSVEKELECPNEFYQSTHPFEFDQRTLLCTLLKEIKQAMRKERDILFEVLFDFLRELPEDFDRDHTTYAEAKDIIKTFMDKHGLTDDDSK